MIKTGNTQQLAEAQSIAAQAGDWLWGVLQGDFNENPTTSQIVVGTIISMIPVVDQLMDVRDICANVMLLTDDDETNDTGAWIAFTLTGIGLVPTVGSAAKGVGKVIIKNADESLSAALATIRKLGKGDPVQFIRDINWSSLCATAAAEVKNILKGLRDALDEAAKSWTYGIILPDVAIDGMQNTVRQIDEVLPKIEQNMQKAAEHIDNKVSKALDKYEGEPPISGVTNTPNSAKAPELEPPKGNDLPGAQEKPTTKTKKARKPSARLKYLGRTPGKKSRTGREVIAKMKTQGKIRETHKGTEFQASDGQWYPLSEADMAHDPTDAVKWWNTTGRKYGPKSKEVRKWMLDSNNYTLDHYSINRSAGAKLNDRYLPPKK